MTSDQLVWLPFKGGVGGPRNRAKACPEHTLGLGLALTYGREGLPDITPVGLGPPSGAREGKGGAHRVGILKGGHPRTLVPTEQPLSKKHHNKGNLFNRRGCFQRGNPSHPALDRRGLFVERLFGWEPILLHQRNSYGLRPDFTGSREMDLGRVQSFVNKTALLRRGTELAQLFSSHTPDGLVAKLVERSLSSGARGDDWQACLAYLAFAFPSCSCGRYDACREFLYSLNRRGLGGLAPLLECVAALRQELCPHGTSFQELPPSGAAFTAEETHSGTGGYEPTGWNIHSDGYTYSGDNEDDRFW